MRLCGKIWWSLTGHRRQYNTAHALCMLGSYGYNHTLRMPYNTYCFFTATVVTRAGLDFFTPTLTVLFYWVCWFWRSELTLFLASPIQTDQICMSGCVCPVEWHEQNIRSGILKSVHWLTIVFCRAPELTLTVFLHSVNCFTGEYVNTNGYFTLGTNWFENTALVYILEDHQGSK